MKRLFILLLTIALANAFPGSALAEKEKIPEKAKELLTAIDVAESIQNGAADAEIAVLLSSQAGFDREAALKKGETDRQIIIKLLSGTGDAAVIADKNKAVTQKFAADKFFKEAKYDKAATGYSLAIKSSRDDFALYKSRGDSYRQYLAAKVAASKGVKDEPRRAALERAGNVLCGCMNSDYNMATKFNNETRQKIESRMIVLKDDMSNKRMSNLTKGDVAPYHYRAAGNIQSMREIDSLYRAHRAARQNEIGLKKAMDEYKRLCSKDDASLQESMKVEKDKGREKNVPAK